MRNWKKRWMSSFSSSSVSQVWMSLRQSVEATVSVEMELEVATSSAVPRHRLMMFFRVEML